MGWLIVIAVLLFGKRILSSLVSLAVLGAVLIGGYMLLSSNFDLGAFDAMWLLEQVRELLDKFFG